MEFMTKSALSNSKKEVIIMTFYTRGSYGKVYTVENAWEVMSTENQEVLKEDYIKQQKNIQEKGTITNKSDDKLNEAINIALDKVSEELPDNEILLIHLTGSRFYGYNRDDSDYDFLVWIKPTDRELVFGGIVSKDINLDNKLVDSIKVKDIRLLISWLKKPSLNTLPLLANPVYYSLSASEFANELKSTAKFSINENRKQVGMSMLGAVRNNKRSNRVMLTMFVYHISEFLIDDENELDLSKVKTFGMMVKSEYKDRKVPDELESLESDLFEKWKDKPSNPKYFDYESLLLRGDFL